MKRMKLVVFAGVAVFTITTQFAMYSGDFYDTASLVTAIAVCTTGAAVALWVHNPYNDEGDEPEPDPPRELPPPNIVQQLMIRAAQPHVEGQPTPDEMSWLAQHYRLAGLGETDDTDDWADWGTDVQRR